MQCPTLKLNSHASARSARAFVGLEQTREEHRNQRLNTRARTHHVYKTHACTRHMRESAHAHTHAHTDHLVWRCDEGDAHLREPRVHGVVFVVESTAHTETANIYINENKSHVHTEPKFICMCVRILVVCVRVCGMCATS